MNQFNDKQNRAKKPNVILISHTPNPEKVIASAGKLCYSSSDIENLMNGLDDKKCESFVSMLSDLGHESAIEHISFTFGIEGVSRTLTHQLVRHRLASYSQQSQRYVSEKAFDFVIPPEIENLPQAKEEFLQMMDACQKSY
ncbi:MAG: FAD-dependent thymidylate synthase, partial [Oscillospiraceae bacterium]